MSQQNIVAINGVHSGSNLPIRVGIEIIETKCVKIVHTLAVNVSCNRDNSINLS